MGTVRTRTVITIPPVLFLVLSLIVALVWAFVTLVVTIVGVVTGDSVVPESPWATATRGGRVGGRFGSTLGLIGHRNPY